MTTDLGPVRPAQHRYRLTCERCGYTWHVTGTVPPACAACRSRYWDTPRGTLKRGRPAK